MLAAAILGAGLYGTAPWWSNGGGSECAASGATLARLAPLARGDVAAFEAGRNATAIPDLSFSGPDGSGRRLSDYRGRTVLLNLWATWCEPCKREMPALDRLQAELGGPDFAVLAVNIDTRDLDRPKTWLATAGIARLGYLSDPTAKIFQELRQIGDAEGMPTTVLVDPRGCRLGRMSGPADWASADGLNLIRAALGRS